MFTIETQADIDAVCRHAVDNHHGFGALPRESAYGKLEIAPGTYAATVEEKMPLIPEVEWKERIEEMTAKKEWPEDKWQAAGGPAIQQNGYSWCWAASGGQFLMGLRLLNNMPFVNLGWEYAAQMVGWQNQGYYLDKWLAWVAKNGLPERSFVPDLCDDPRAVKSGAKDNAQNYRFDAVEVWDGSGDFSTRRAQAVSALLSKVFWPYVAYNRLSHAMTLSKLYYDSRGRLCGYSPNTWGPGRGMNFVGDLFVPDELYIVRVPTYYVAA